ncbi:hypothetical protein QQ045_001843 [Rhodiola kirilowii]
MGPAAHPRKRPVAWGGGGSQGSSFGSMDRAERTAENRGEGRLEEEQQEEGEIGGDSMNGKVTAVEVEKAGMPEVWARSSAKWMFTLVGWIFGAVPALGIVRGFVRAKWGDESVVTVSVLKPGLFVFKFSREEDCNRILALGPWSFDNKPLVLKPGLRMKIMN